MTLPTRWFPLASLVCAVLSSLLLLPGLHGGFVFDDTVNIIYNPAVQMGALDANGLHDAYFGRQPGGITRILPTLSFALDYWRGGGLDPAVFKTTNIAIHALTTFVLAFFFRGLLQTAGNTRARAGIGSLALALAWGLHPLQVSSVLYVVQRMQTMCTLFIVLALWAYLKAREAQIGNRPSRRDWLLTILLWAMAFGCKEDAILLPAYTLALELTVLQFRAANPALARALRKGYLFSTLASTAIFLLAIVPHYWSWDIIPGRDFSTWERLLTQARVLCTYLWQIVFPLPRHMPFYYDWLQPSHGLLNPWTTLPAILLVFALLATAWQLRKTRPLFALGIFLFFSGHFITSNVMNLELAFEHRNHFPLIGAVLAVGDLMALAWQRRHIRPAMAVATCVLLLGLLGNATVVRARSWDSPFDLARTSTELAPDSSRAWNSLSQYYYELGGRNTPNNPYLDRAIDACKKGAANAPYSSACLTNLIVFKSIKGTATKTDWNRYIDRLQRINMGPENSMAIWVLLYNGHRGVKLDDESVIKAISVITHRMQFNPAQYAAIGYFILGDTQQPDQAFPYLERAVEMSPGNDAFNNEIINNMKTDGRQEWAKRLEALAKSQSKPLPSKPGAVH